MSDKWFAIRQFPCVCGNAYPQGAYSGFSVPLPIMVVWTMHTRWHFSPCRVSESLTRAAVSPNKLSWLLGSELGVTHGLVAGPLCSSPCSLWQPEDSCSSGKPCRCGEVWTVIPEDALRAFRGDIVMTKMCVSFRYVCVSKARYFLDWGDGREATWIQIPVYVICQESEIQHLCSLYACVSKTAGLSPSFSPPQPVFLAG